MNLIKIDQPTKIVLEYIEKLRGAVDIKRQKLNIVTSAVRPSDFPGISTQQLCDILIRFAFNGSFVDETFRDHILDLVVDESLTWNQILHSVLNTKSDQLYLKSQLCSLVQKMIHFVQIKSFNDRKHADTLVSIINPTFMFLTKLILDLLSDEDELDTMQIDSEDGFRAYQRPLEALNTLIHDDLCGPLLALSKSSEEVTQQLQQCLNAFSKLHCPDKTAISLMELLVDKHNENCKPTEYQYNPEGLVLYDLKNPSIRILVPIFACFRCHEPSTHVANVVQTFAEIMRLPGNEVVFDLLHAAILLKCEESIELLHLPKQHRLDFRWQATVFFYKKLPQIIEHLVEGGKVTAEDVKIGMEKALNDLSMLFDAADVSWQNASFITLLNALEPVIGSEAANPLRQRRREHMKTTANLIPLADTDNTLIENTDIDKLLTAVKAVMNLQYGQKEEFWQFFLQKVNAEDYDDFDAVTSVLTSEGKLYEAGRAFSIKNRIAQVSSMLVSAQDRIRVFDETFLLLSRIIIKNPGLSISLFVNGGPGKTDAEQAMLYKWSMWFVKRVPKTLKETKPKSEEEIKSLKKDAEMLVRLMNAEVGINDEDQEEEEEEEDDEDDELLEKETEEEEEKETEDTVGNNVKETEKEIKEEEMPDEKGTEEEKEQEIDDVEKMDTSEEPPASLEAPLDPLVNSNPPDVPEDQKEPVPIDAATEHKINDAPAVTTEKKKEPPLSVSWNELHCPLPRVTKKNARHYLSELKEGRPFWREDDKNLNLGFILAAIPKIGHLLIKEHVEKKSHRLDRKAAEEHMTNIIHAIETMPCLFVCLVQWVDCETSSAARTSLVLTMKHALEKRINSSMRSIADDKNLSKWKFVKSTVQEMIHEITDRTRVFPEVTCTVFTTAKRFCPFVTRDEMPDQIKLKHAWFFMRQQAWASPHALRILEHCNLAGEFRVWSHSYINKTIQTQCGEIMKSSTDLIFTLSMLDELNVGIRMQESLMEYWLSEDAGQCQLDGRFDPLSMTAVIRLMTHLMLIAEWALDRLLSEGPIVEPQPYSEIETPQQEDPERREKWIFLIRSTLDRTVNRLFKILRKGVLCTVVNTIIQLIKAIAGSADCRAKRLLVKRITPEMIFQLAYIEPECVDYALMNSFCDPDDEEHTRTKIMFLCARRRTKVF